jgi:hypothetical protein
MKARTDLELLADLEKDLAELQTAISVIKKRLGQAAPPSPTHVGSNDDQRVQGKPFLGLSVLDASKKYLRMVKEPKAPSEIAEALHLGGVHSRSSDFNGIVRTTLFKRGHEVGIEKFGKGKWGLDEWRPGRRNSQEPQGGEEP